MKSVVLGFLSAIVFLQAGCATQTCCIFAVRNAVPAYRLPTEFRTCSRRHMTPIDLSLLGQQRPGDGHRIADGDLLGVYVAGVLPPKLDDQAMIIPPLNMAGNFYYPPYGRISTPAVGVPVDVRSNGKLRLPLVGPIDLNGHTLDKATEIIRTTYEEAGVIQKDRERVSLTLLRPRVHRVVVLRDDAQSPMPQFVPKVAVPYTKIGHGEVVDLPAYENDVLHALATSGGLPGLDVFSEVWIFRNRQSESVDPALFQQQLSEAGSAQKLAERWTQGERQVVRIPLRVDPEEPLPFTQDDILLEDGDVVYLPPREIENFYTGGQLPGGKVPLPRDQDTDVLEAIALVNGTTGGPATNASIFRTGPGNLYPPTQGLIVRKLPNGQQLRIRVDLNRALHDPSERILIQPEDQFLLFYKPSEFYANLLLNYVGFTIDIVPK
jgi:protein involved in polysaccharide export with SLBB domain